MEVLSRLLRQACKNRDFSYHPQCVRVGMNHLIFADDLLIFTRGDVPAVKTVAHCLTHFAAISGLVANPTKTSIYFGGVRTEVKHKILEATEFTEGKFPFKYLGFPLNASRLTVDMYSQLLTRIRDKVAGWAEQLLSYSGKLQLINSVIFGLQNFWSCVMLLPKMVIKGIKKLCRDFLWGSINHKRMVWKKWDNFCLPRSEGGFDIREILSWNKCLLLKWVVKLENHQDDMWCDWIFKYNLKSDSIWDVVSDVKHSMSWKHILQARDTLIDKAGGINNAKLLLAKWSSTGKLNMNQAYNFLRPKGNSVQWSKTIWDQMCIPKHSFIAVLAIQNELATVDNIIKRGMPLVSRCVLCLRACETVDHIFFNCSFSGLVWEQIKFWLNIKVPSNSLMASLRWFTHCNRGKHQCKRQRRCSLVATVYELWRERNCRIFQSKAREASVIVKSIQFQVCVRAVFKARNGNEDSIIANLL